LRRGWIATVLLAALLIPMLAGVLPRAAVSAEQALLADITRGICKPDQDPGMPATPVQHDMCCILCAAGSPPPAAKTAGLEILPLPDSRRTALVPEDPIGPRPGLYRAPAIPRGPPAA
jgi:hypothetical protein